MPLHAVDVQALDVQDERGIYHVTIRFSVNASLNRVRAVITDYAHLSALNPAIVASRVLSAPRGRIMRVSTRMRVAYCSCARLSPVSRISVRVVPRP
ncbi:MAG: hypothetical protein M3294_03425 [Pseudomonadota bacterium]|nr:hypothetical protein [Pseudomonadota bacterium]